MTKISRLHFKIFGGKATNSNMVQFGSTRSELGPQYTKNINTLQSLPAYEYGWQEAIKGNSAPVLEEVNALQHIVSTAVAYLYQQGGASVEWNTNTVYYNGSLVSKIASPTSSLLGTDASKVTLVYRSVQNNNQGNALPADFLSDEHWAWVDAIQPQGLNLLALNIPVYSFMYLANDGLHPHEVPVNCAIADGRTYTCPDGSTGTTLNLVDRFPLGANGAGGTGGSFVTSTNTDGEHAHGISFTSGGHTLSVAEMPSHNHRYSRQEGIWRVEGGGSRIADITYNDNHYTYATGGNQSHTHGISGSTNDDGIHKHHNFDITNPYIKLLPIERIF